MFRTIKIIKVNVVHYSSSYKHVLNNKCAEISTLLSRVFVVANGAVVSAFDAKRVLEMAGNITMEIGRFDWPMGPFVF